ncbi:MAG: PepSY domain-containing protein, partial [Dyella sp.]
MSASHRLLKVMRLVHLYLGVFTAPMLVFFAITGGLQTFGLHEASRGGGYTPPGWLASLGQLHKKQTTQVPQRRPRPVDAAARPDSSTGGAPTAERVAP